ncbi:phospholipase D-like domain-containing protein [Rhodovulum sulfidophilum]|nr:phospholipase D-like domain-containing protein [Rhodovulum sulfidophilum]
MMDRDFDFDAHQIKTVSQIGRPLGMAWVSRTRFVSEPDLGSEGLLPADASRRLEDALVKMIGAAQEMVVLCSFLVASDRLTEALETAARRGVRVYMMLASEARLGQEREEDDFSKRCRKDHEQMLRRLAPHAMIRSAAHYHAKTVLIDPKHPNAQGWLLTANITDEALTRNEELGLRLTIEEVRSVFAELRHACWERAEHRMIGTDFKPTKPLEAVEPPSEGLALVTSPTHRSIRETALHLVEQAETRIIVASFGWALDHPVTKALIARAKAGVKITILARIRPAAMPALAALAEVGAEVCGFEWLHAKAIWTDRGRAMIMTANLERRGMDEGFELGVKLEGARASTLRQILDVWEGAAKHRLDPAAAIKPETEAVKRWRNGALSDLQIPKSRPVDLGSVAMCSLLDPIPGCPSPEDELPLAHEVILQWRVVPPRVSANASPVDAEEKTDKKDKTPETFPALMREVSGRRVVVISDHAQLDAAARIAEERGAKAVVMNRSA